MHGGSTKPGSITYGVHDIPPVGTIIPLVMQHVAMLSVELVFPVVVVTLAGGTVDMARDAVSLMMIAMGVGTIFQILRLLKFAPSLILYEIREHLVALKIYWVSMHRRSNHGLHKVIRMLSIVSVRLCKPVSRGST